MTKFIFALETNSPDEIELMGAPAFSVVVSTNDYFMSNECVQDDYEPNDYDQLVSVMSRYNLAELTESYFEPDVEETTRADITANLNNEPLFNFSQAFQDFIDDNPNND